MTINVTPVAALDIPEMIAVGRGVVAQIGQALLLLEWTYEQMGTEQVQNHPLERLSSHSEIAWFTVSFA